MAATVFRFSFFLAISLADQEIFEAPDCQLLQTRIQLSETAATKGRERNQSEMIAAGICVPKLPKQELSEPILNVSSLYDQDGWCVFGYVGTWASECAVSRRKRDVINFTAQYQGPDASYLNVSWATPVALQLADNRTLIIRDHVYPLDDLYCYVNGWYSLPRHEIVNNFSYLEEVSNRWCDHLAEIVPGYYNISMVDLNNESQADLAFLKNLMKNGADTGYVPQSVIDGMYLHAASKCLMGGHSRGAVCAQRGCLSSPSSSQLLYTVRGECESVAG